MSEIVKLEVDEISLVDKPANKQPWLLLKKEPAPKPSPDRQVIAQAIDALQAVLTEADDSEMAAVKQLIQWLSEMPDTEIVMAPGAAEYLLSQPPGDLAKETLEALVVQDAMREAGQRHTNEEYALFDQVIELLKRLRGKSPKEAQTETSQANNDPQAQMRQGYKGNFKEAVEILREIDPAKREWEVRIIRAGISKNGRRYPLDVLRHAAPLFEGVRVYTYRRLLDGKEYFDHLSEDELKANPDGYARDLAGFIKQPRIQGADLVGTLHIFPGSAWLHENLQDASRHGLPMPYGLSIDAEGDGHRGEHMGGEETILDVDAIHHVRSVDVVTHAAAGGQFLRLVASRTPMFVGGGQDMPAELTELEKRIALGECRLALREALDDSGLPPEIRAVIKQQFDGKLFEAKDLDAAIASAKVDIEKRQREAEEQEIAKMGDGVHKMGDAYVVMSGGKLKGRFKTKEEADKAYGMKEAHAADAAALDATLQEAKRIIEAAQERERKTAELEQRMQLRECTSILKEKLADSKLPAQAQGKIEKQFKGRVFEAQELDTAIAEMRDLLASLDVSGNVRLPGQERLGIRMGESEPDKIMLALDGFWAGEDLPGQDKLKVRRFRSLKEAWAQIMRQEWDPQEVLRESVVKKYDSHGRVGIQAQRMAESRGGKTLQQRFAEALTTSSWAQILGDSITRRMMVEYVLDELQDWRLITSEIGNVTDFRSQRRMRFGGYGVLPVVDQGVSYTELTSPTDQEATYSISKKGGLETITLEMLANDDVGALRRIPQRLGRAAGETLYRGVFDLINDNSALTYDDDTTALFTSGHGNLETLALSSANLDTGIQDMMAQTAYGNSREYLRLRPAFIIHVRALWRTAYRLTNTDAGAEGEPESTDRNANPFRSYGIRRIQVDYWTSTTKWVLVANPRTVPTIEVGFFNGNEDPELFIADQENVGGSSQFNADKISYKIRHLWGVCLLEHRSMVRGNA